MGKESIVDIDTFVGHTISGYKLSKPIGFGAFAYVYVGQKNDELAAFKVLYEQSNEAKMRFIREAKVMQALPTSDHVVRYIGHGDTDNGHPYISMEYVDGITLQEGFRRKTALDPKRACEFLLQLCDAFSGLHRHGLVHRDIKPGNILINRKNQIKLIDFGLVKDAQGLLRLFEEIDILDGQDFQIELEHGLLVGTPEYLAPEQISDVYLKEGARTETDTYSDVYSLGLIFYQLLTGVNPFPFKEDPRKRGYQKKLESYLKQRLQKQSEELPPVTGIDDDLRKILNSTLRLDPRERPKDAMMLHDYLELYLEEDADFVVDDEMTAVVSMDEMIARIDSGDDGYFGAIESSAPAEVPVLPPEPISQPVDEGPKKSAASYLFRNRPKSMPHSMKGSAAGTTTGEPATKPELALQDGVSPPSIEGPTFDDDEFSEEPTRVDGKNIEQTAISQSPLSGGLVPKGEGSRLALWIMISIALGLILAFTIIILIRN